MGRRERLSGEWVFETAVATIVAAATAIAAVM